MARKNEMTYMVCGENNVANCRTAESNVMHWLERVLERETFGIILNWLRKDELGIM